MFTPDRVSQKNLSTLQDTIYGNQSFRQAVIGAGKGTLEDFETIFHTFFKIFHTFFKIFHTFFKIFHTQIKIFHTQIKILHTEIKFSTH